MTASTVCVGREGHVTSACVKVNNARSDIIETQPSGTQGGNAIVLFSHDCKLPSSVLGLCSIWG